MKCIKKIVMINIFLILLLISVSSVSSAEVTVNGNNSTSQIQSIITDTDKDIVLEGEFKNLSTINITRDIKISGNNAIITRNASTSGNLTLFHITAANVIIENLIIKGYDTTIVSSSSNLVLRNNQITSVYTAINITTNGDLNNVEIKNNVISTSRTSAYGISLSSISGNIYNNIISGNKITTDVSNAVGIYFNANNGNLYDNTIINNNIATTTTGNGAYGIQLRSTNGVIRNNDLINNTIKTRSAHGIYIFATNGVIENNRVNFNNITFIVATQTNSSGIFFNSQPGNMSNNNVSNNNLAGIVTNPGGAARGINLNVNSASNMINNTISNNNISIDSAEIHSYGIFVYAWSGYVNNTNIYGNNIIAKSTAIRVGASTGTINHLNISYNRILTNGKFITLDKTGSGSLGINNTASANWFGNNTPDMSKFENINVLSYYVVNATVIKNNALVGENWTIKYSFYLNNTDDAGEFNRLPFFLSRLLNITENQVDERLAYNTGIWSIAIEHPKIDDFTIVLDNEIIPLNEFVSQKGKTNLTGNVDGELLIDNTVTIEAILKTIQGNVLANKVVTLIVDGNIIGNQTTDSDGRVSFTYTFKNSGDNVINFVFEEDEDFEGSNYLKIVKVSENLIPDTKEDIIDENAINIPENYINNSTDAKDKKVYQTSTLVDNDNNKDNDKDNVNTTESENLMKNSKALMKSTGNPLILIAFSLLMFVLVPSLKTRKRK